jgi:hypothetical protein
MVEVKWARKCKVQVQVRIQSQEERYEGTKIQVTRYKIPGWG